MKQIISTTHAPQAIGHYSQAIHAGDYVFISGQLPINPLSGKIDETEISKQAKQVFSNISGILKAAGLTFDDVVKVTLLLTDINDFSQVNEVYNSYFTFKAARVTFQVAALPMNAKIETEVIAYKPSTR